jgi:hypothetical protein
MSHTTFRKRGQKRVTVFSGADVTNLDENNPQSNVSIASSHHLDRIRKGMTVSEVERILGQGDTDPQRTPGKFAVVNYRDRENGIAVVYRDQRVVSRAFIH